MRRMHRESVLIWIAIAAISVYLVIQIAKWN